MRADGRTDGQTDRQTDMKKLITTFHNFAMVSKTSHHVHTDIRQYIVSMFEAKLPFSVS
jgi:hypothetical protein